MKMRKFVLCFLATILVIATASSAQEVEKAQISGRVTDKIGAGIANAEIKIIPQCKCSDCKSDPKCGCCPNQVTITTITDKAGYYEVSVHPGFYMVGVRGKEVVVTARRNETKSVNISVEQ